MAVITRDVRDMCAQCSVKILWVFESIKWNMSGEEELVRYWTAQYIKYITIIDISHCVRTAAILSLSVSPVPALTARLKTSLATFITIFSLNESNFWAIVMRSHNAIALRALICVPNVCPLDPQSIRAIAEDCRALQYFIGDTLHNKDINLYLKRKYI